MKTKVIFLIIFILSSCPLSAQVTALAQALARLNEQQEEWTITFVADELQGLQVETSALPEEVDVPEAVERLTKGLPVRVKVKKALRQIYVQRKQDKDMMSIHGKVLDNMTRNDLPGAVVTLMTRDSTIIDTREAKSFWMNMDNSGYTSDFYFEVPHRQQAYILKATFDGHDTTYVDYNLSNVGRREFLRELPPILMHKTIRHAMREVTVTASKVMFYYRGDTVVYNADAFQLAEGSMLDALVKQLPGVELKDGGEITVNGKRVEALLLNGKDFFRGNNRVMLENLPAYTVKQLEVYEKYGDKSEFLGQQLENDKRYVMDVKLKREYSIGWLVNAEAGASPFPTSPKGEESQSGNGQAEKSSSPLGEDRRGLFRLFAMRHSDFSRIAIVANANNLDDDSKPGEGDNWQRGKTNDLRRTERADIGGFVSDRNKRWEFSGNVSVNHQRTEGASRTVRQNYLSSGDTYDHSFTSRTGEDLRLGGWLSFYRNFKNVRWHIDPSLNYHHFNNSSDLASATFNAPVADVSRQLLNDLFSPNATRINLRDTLVNRILRQGSGRGHTWDGTFHTGATIKIPHTNENLRLGAGINLIGSEERMFDKQSVSFAATPLQPSSPSSSSSFHHLRDNHPTRDGKAYFNLGYNIPLGEGWRAIHATYSFEHLWQHHRSTLYLLEESPLLTSPMGEESLSSEQTSNPIPLGGGWEGALPSLTDYYQVMDRANSFDSHSRENRHKLDINLGYKFNKASYGQIWTLLNGDITLHQQHLDYQRGSIDTTLCRTAVSITMDDNTYLDFKNGQIGMTMGIRQVLPALEQRIDLRDDTDPMNVRLGNTRLHPSVTPDFGAYFTFRSKQGFQRWEWHHAQTFNAVAMGYTYDTQTGARTYRPENVNGNYTSDGGYTFHHNFGTDQKVSIDLPLHLTLIQSVDITGGERSTVHRLNLSFSPSVKADIGKQHFEFTCQPAWDRLTSDRSSLPLGGGRGERPDFSAFTCRTSLSAILKLPWKLDLSTDLNLYTRTGYADTALNTSDFVWNARLSRPFFKGKFLVLLDGFDILGQLSNVTRVMNAQGRTETYTNVMPRYVLLHAVWRFNKQPKKR